MIIEDKLMRYVLYKKRTENEIRQKCISMNYEEYYIEEVIEYLKEAEYIDDRKYIEKYMEEIKKLKHLSIAQIRNDLIKKGVDSYLIDLVIEDESIEEFEYASAEYLANKKFNLGEDVEKIKRYLLNKGYSYSNVSKAIDNLENIEDN